MAGKKGKSGGKRENQTGRPPNEPVDYDEKFKGDVLEAIRQLEEKHKIPFLVKIFGRVYDDKTQDTAVTGILKTYSEIFTVKKTESKVEGVNGPKLYVPERDKE